MSLSAQRYPFACIRAASLSQSCHANQLPFVASTVRCAMGSNLDFDIGLGLEGTHVLITGAAGQIGQVVVKAFLSAGANVTALDINESRLSALQQQQHTNLQCLAVDVTDEEALAQAFEQARSKFGLVSTCCAVAGLDLSFIPHHQTICDLPLDQWQRTIGVNTMGTFLTARTWLRGVKSHAHSYPTTLRNVSLIIFGSEAGVFGTPGNADYATSKAAIQYGLTRSMAPEVVRIVKSARVNAIAPGAVNTPQFQIECAEGKDVRYQDSEATVALKTSVRIESVARACLLLASENYSGNITGQVISVNSGASGKRFWLPDGSSTW